MRDRQIGRETHPKSREALSDLQAGDSFPGELPLSHWWILKNSQKSTKVVIKQKLCPNSWTYFYKPTLKLINNLPFRPLMNMKLFLRASCHSGTSWLCLVTAWREKMRLYEKVTLNGKKQLQTFCKIYIVISAPIQWETLHFDTKLCVILN